MLGPSLRGSAHERRLSRTSRTTDRAGAHRRCLASRARLARSAFARVCALCRAGTPNGACTALDAHGGSFPSRWTCQPNTVPRATPRHGIARTRTQTARPVAGVCGFLGIWNRQRSVRMEPFSMVRPAHGSSQAGLGIGFRLVVDDSRALCRGRAADGEFAEGRTNRLDQPGKLTETSAVPTILPVFRLRVMALENEISKASF